jgi:hypothetical protein
VSVACFDGEKMPPAAPVLRAAHCPIRCFGVRAHRNVTRVAEIVFHIVEALLIVYLRL